MRNIQNDVLQGKEIKKQEYKYFVTSRAKQVELESICKKGYGGTSTIRCSFILQKKT